MAFTTLTQPQNKFLETHLRGTKRQLSQAQAEATYGIKNLTARISELRAAGLNVHTGTNKEGRTAYSMSRRDTYGSQFKIFA